MSTSIHGTEVINSILDTIDQKTGSELKDDEIRSLLFDNSELSCDDYPNLEIARSRLWFKWSGADVIKQKFPSDHAHAMMHYESKCLLKDGLRTILDVTENEIDKDISRTFSDSELRERFQVKNIFYRF